MNEATTGAKALRIALAFLLAASTMLTALLSALPQQAYAATATLIDTGDRFDFRQHDSHTGSTWDDNVFIIDGKYAYCIDIQSRAYEGSTYSSSSMDEGTALKIGLYEKYLDTEKSHWSLYKRMGYLQYMIWCTYSPGYMDSYVTPENDDFYEVFAAAKSFYESNKDIYEATGIEWHSSNSQSMCTSVEVKIKLGNLELTKGSGNKAVSDGNGCYSLKGAVYTIYSDEACKNEAGTITTNSAGYGICKDLVRGSYWVKETTPAPGYALDETVYATEVKPGQTVGINGGSVADLPHNDPVAMLVGKVDSATGESRPEGDATLEGAEFTVKFYGGQYSSAAEAEGSGDPLKTWVFKTDSDGFADLADEYKVSGPELYHASNGLATLPLGTVVIQETKAPVGYKLDDGKGGAPKKFCVQITDDGAVGESVYSYNTPEIPDSVKRGDFRLVKEVPVTIYSDGDGGMPQEVKRVLVPGVQFEIINDSENSVVAPDGHTAAPGEKVCTITVDENGLATTKALDKPASWDGALAYGSYVVHEVIPADVNGKFKADYGKDLIAVPDWKISISENAQYDAPQLVNNHIPQTPLKVVKTDAETGKQIPLPCSFQLLDSAGKVVTFTSHYPDKQTMDTWTTNARGEVMLPMLLEEGTYTLTEVQAPEGYVLALEGKTITVGSVYNGWDNPITVDFEDMPQKGTITVAKTDSDTGKPVDGSTYIVKAAADVVTPEGTVRAKAGDIMATLVTGADGKATTPELYLGTYTVYEAKAKDGYALDIAEKTVTLEYQGQEISVFDEPVDVTDTPTEIKLHKVDSTDPEKPVANAKFRVWNDEGTFDEEMNTDADGILSLKYATHGTWHVQEVEAPEGYVINDVDEQGNATVHDFTVNDQGMIEAGDGTMCAVFEWTVENMPKTMKTTATDEQNRTHESQASETMVIRDTVSYTGCIPGKEYTVSGTLMDKERGKPVLDHDGKEVKSETTFTAENFAGTVDIVFSFNGADMAGKIVVAFETMTFEGKEYMVHADLEDEAQTVKVIDISTTAKNPTTGDNQGLLDDEFKFIDTVEYKNLTVGAEYTLTGTLMDKETGKPLTDADGNQIVAEATFVPAEPDGTQDVEFTVDSTQLAGKTTVVFEKLANADKVTVATHEDIDDEGQSIIFADIHTNAVDGTDSDKNVVAGEKAQVVDTVTYKNLVPGKEYVLTGKLMDKATGEPLKDAKGNEITSQSTFTPEAAEGTVDAIFEFDATGLEGKKAVAFETLTRDGIEIAVHADIDDADQTVDIVTPDEDVPGKGYPKTGGTAAVVAVAGASAAALAAFALAGGGSALLKRRKADIDAADEIEDADGE